MTYGYPHMSTKVADPNWDFVIYLIPTEEGKMLAVCDSPNRLDVKSVDDNTSLSDILSSFSLTEAIK